MHWLFSVTHCSFFLCTDFFLCVSWKLSPTWSVYFKSNAVSLKSVKVNTAFKLMQVNIDRRRRCRALKHGANWWKQMEQIARQNILSAWDVVFPVIRIFSGWHTHTQAHFFFLKENSLWQHPETYLFLDCTNDAIHIATNKLIAPYKNVYFFFWLYIYFLPGFFFVASSVISRVFHNKMKIFLICFRFGM